MGELGLIPGLGRYPGEGNGYPLQYSGLENSMDCIVHWVAKNLTQLSNFSPSVLTICTSHSLDFKGCEVTLTHIYPYSINNNYY